MLKINYYPTTIVIPLQRLKRDLFIPFKLIMLYSAFAYGLNSEKLKEELEKLPDKVVFVAHM